MRHLFFPSLSSTDYRAKYLGPAPKKARPTSAPIKCSDPHVPRPGSPKKLPAFEIDPQTRSATPTR